MKSQKNLLDSEIRNVRGHYEAYKDGEFICSGDTLTEVEKELELMQAELDQKQIYNKYLVSWLFVDKDDSVRSKSMIVEAENEEEAKNKVTNKRARDVKAIKLTSQSNTFAEEFKLYENMFS